MLTVRPCLIRPHCKTAWFMWQFRLMRIFPVWIITRFSKVFCPWGSKFLLQFHPVTINQTYRVDLKDLDAFTEVHGVINDPIVLQAGCHNTVSKSKSEGFNLNTKKTIASGHFSSKSSQRQVIAPFIGCPIFSPITCVQLHIIHDWME